MPNSREESPVACELKGCGGHMMLADTLKVICDIYDKCLRELTSAKEGKDHQVDSEENGWESCRDTAALKRT